MDASKLAATLDEIQKIQALQNFSETMSTSNSAEAHDSNHRRSFSQKTSKCAEIHNLSGLRKVRIRFLMEGGDDYSEGAIHGLIFEFDEQLDRPPVHFVTENSTRLRHNDIYEQFLEIGTNDAIDTILVWKYRSQVRGIKFELKSGFESDIYGLHGFIYHNWGGGPPEGLGIERHQTSLEIFGIAGTFGVVLENIQVFHSVSTYRPRPPTVDRKKERDISESSKLAATKDENKDVVMGWAMVMSIFITGALVSWMGRRK